MDRMCIGADTDSRGHIHGDMGKAPSSGDLKPGSYGASSERCAKGSATQAEGSHHLQPVFRPPSMLSLA